MFLLVVRDRQSNGAKGDLDIPREVYVYVTSRLNGGRKVDDYMSARNHNSRMLIRPDRSRECSIEPSWQLQCVAPSIFADVAL